jgi:hypothetical protein
MSSWHSNWSAMRGVSGLRNWWTWAEFSDGLRQAGLEISRYHVRQATRACPVQVIQGVARYQQHHVELAIEYAKSKGFVR